MPGGCRGMLRSGLPGCSAHIGAGARQFPLAPCACAPRPQRIPSRSIPAVKLHQRWLFWQCTPRTSCGVCPGPAANLPPQCALASNPAWGPCTHTLVLDTVLNQPRSFFIGQCLEMQQCHHDLRCADVRAASYNNASSMVSQSHQASPELPHCMAQLLSMLTGG